MNLRMGRKIKGSRKLKNCLDFAKVQTQGKIELGGILESRIRSSLEWVGFRGRSPWFCQYEAENQPIFPIQRNELTQSFTFIMFASIHSVIPKVFLNQFQTKSQNIKFLELLVSKQHNSIFGARSLLRELLVFFLQNLERVFPNIKHFLRIK